DLELKTATPILWLNGSALNIREASLDSGGRSVGARSAPGGDSFVGFGVDAPVGPGPPRLHIPYQGTLSRKAGEGPVAQHEGGGEWCAFSQFEPMGARRAFPCFDEPSFKIPWRVTLRVRPADVALSNAPEASSSVDPGGLRQVVFEETKPLPSYLVAVAAGPFELVSAGKAGPKGPPGRGGGPKGPAPGPGGAGGVTP